jgi:hypothetical protein
MKDRTMVALVTVPVCGILIWLGHNGAIIALLSTIIGWYFGRESGEKEKEGE